MDRVALKDLVSKAVSSTQEALSSSSPQVVAAYALVGLLPDLAFAPALPEGANPSVGVRWGRPDRPPALVFRWSWPAEDRELALEVQGGTTVGVSYHPIPPAYGPQVWWQDGANRLIPGREDVKFTLDDLFRLFVDGVPSPPQA